MADISGSQIPEIWETEEDKKLSIDELRRFYKEFALKNFRHKPIHQQRYRLENQGLRSRDRGNTEVQKKRAYYFSSVS
jgi:hypothetical protein